MDANDAPGRDGQVGTMLRRQRVARFHATGRKWSEAENRVVPYYGGGAKASEALCFSMFRKPVVSLFNFFEPTFFRGHVEFQRCLEGVATEARRCTVRLYFRDISLALFKLHYLRCTVPYNAVVGHTERQTRARC